MAVLMGKLWSGLVGSIQIPLIILFFEISQVSMIA